MEQKEQCKRGIAVQLLQNAGLLMQSAKLQL